MAKREEGSKKHYGKPLKSPVTIDEKVDQMSLVVFQPGLELFLPHQYMTLYGELRSTFRKELRELLEANPGNLEPGFNCVNSHFDALEKRVGTEVLGEALEKYKRKFPHYSLFVRDETTTPPSSSEPVPPPPSPSSNQPPPPPRKDHICVKCQLKGKWPRCNHCKQVHYCSIICQQEDWEKHKPNCKSTTVEVKIPKKTTS